MRTKKGFIDILAFDINGVYTKMVEWHEEALKMKEGIHPNLHKIKVVMTDGAEFETSSTWGKEGDTINLDIDPKSHPAWIGGGKRLIDSGGQISKFGKRFQNFGLKKNND
ncbi:MAG: 50S ribosomal protein L31 [Holosporales bacterium]|nr:50S ribosomal protein L31 [Holosporales bacterium]